MFLARLKLAQGDVNRAAAILTEADQFVRQHGYTHRLAEVAAARVVTLLHQGNLATAARLVEAYDLPLSRARVHLAQGDPAAALAVLDPWRREVEAKAWPDEHLKVLVLEAVAHRAHGETDEALHLLGEALTLAKHGGFIRTFVDEGAPMAQLLSEASGRGMMPGYTEKLLAAFEDEDITDLSPEQSFVEPLSSRELEVLALIAQGLSNREIGERLFIALSTVKGHNQNIYGKLQVSRRTEAVARARELGLL
jgi:LuxR family maltose regulon positive regulatory protein